jgi:hypothetical protein
MKPYVNHWSHATEDNAEIKSILEYFADKGCLGFLHIRVSNALDLFTFAFGHKDEKFAFSYYGENLYTITDLSNHRENTYFKPKALEVMSDIVIGRMVDDVRQELSLKFSNIENKELWGCWNLFLAFLHNAFIYQLRKDSYYTNYNEDDDCIELTLFNERVCIYIYDNGSILVETTEDESFTGNVGEFGFTEKLTEVLTYYSNLI